MEYTLKILKGTKEFVLDELLSKYPNTEILEQTEEKIPFKSDIDLEKYRNLYSPTHISNDKGNILNLSKRDWRRGFVPAGINPSLAYIMCMIADLRPEDILLDPFCGASTIPITALKYFDIKRCVCIDRSESAIVKSKQNFLNAKIEEDRYKLFRKDIQDIKLNKRNIDVIISNLPFGIRVGTHDENIQIYTKLEDMANRLLRTKGRIVLLTQEKKLVREVFKGWDIKSITQVDEGGLLPEIFLIKRK
ncbi:MAG: methyltransferase [Candidatus Dojkabacteria bacterium]|jgi:tRNA (guanine6-N2)-methyltransferase|nr:methyltransferase [Candidatus Dojkabacteria bacterium]